MTSSPPASVTPSSESLEPADSTDPDAWLTQFPTTEDFEKFATATQRNAALARTCLQEAKATQQRLNAAVLEAQQFCSACQERNLARTRKMNQAQENLRILRPR